MIGFFQEIGKLKKLKRKGWIMDSVENPESVAEHSFRTAVMTLVLGKGRDLDLCKAVKMALIHDIAESETGDIVVESKQKYGKHTDREKFDKITDEEKHEIEKRAFGKLSGMLGGKGDEYFELWKEFEEGKTGEAVFVKQIDKLELSLQALEYMTENPELVETLKHYFTYSRDRIKDPELLELLDEIESGVPKK